MAPARVTAVNPQKATRLDFRQVIINLVGNAIKFTETGVVAVRVEKLSSRENEVSLRFSVQDTGIGIPVDKQERIFRVFEQADAGTNRKYGGTGLGLAISSQIVAHMGGTLTVQSPSPCADVSCGDELPGSVFSFRVDFPVVLLDYHMPDANGLEVAEFITSTRVNPAVLLMEYFHHGSVSNSAIDDRTTSDSPMNAT